MAIDEIQTGAEDWRSPGAKRQASLRKASASLFKTWIPDNPEAGIERGQLYSLWTAAFEGHDAKQITYVSMLSSGSDEIMVHEYLEQPQSMQALLVEREGTEAFLDAKNALRVVRKKYGMMTLITRLTQTFEQRSIVAVTIQAGIPQAEMIDFGRLLYRRIEGTSAEEEAELKRAMKRKFPNIDVVYHSELVGRRVPIAWEIKHIYTKVLRELNSRGGGDPAYVVRESAPALKAKALRQLLMHSADLKAELDADTGFDPAPEMIRGADETALLNATRNIYDEFNELRHSISANAAIGVDDAASADFSADVDDADLLELAQALELVRELRGRDFFGRISMVSGEISFVASAHDATGHTDSIEDRLRGMDPTHALREARAITEAFYKARALSAVVEPLRRAGHQEASLAAAKESLVAARACKTNDVDQAYIAAFSALLSAELIEDAAIAVKEAVRRAHSSRELPLRCASLMRITSTLLQSPGLPAAIRGTLAREILGDDVYFWGKPEITPALVEVILALLSPEDADTGLFVQKVVAHPDEEVRRSVVRTMPIGEDEALRNILLSHLRDRETAVRTEVIHRIGYSADQRLSLYLTNHIRQGYAENTVEKRALAIELARLGQERYLPVFNAMLGSLATANRALTDKLKPLKDDPDLQTAALEVLFHLNSRDARRILYKASQQAKRGDMKLLTEQIWGIVKGRSYGEPALPRSPHHPEWTEEDRFDFRAELDALAPEPEPEPVAEGVGEDESEPARRSNIGRPKRGLMNRLKSKLLGKGDDEPETMIIGDDDFDDEEVGEPEQEEAIAPELSGAQVPDEGPPPAAIRYEAVLLEGPEAWSGTIGMEFTLYDEEAADEPIWREKDHDVEVADGHFNVLLGNRKHLPALPNIVWLGVKVDGQLLGPRTRLSKATSVVQG